MHNVIKFKVLISLVIALVMLLAIAAPSLAAAPVKGELTNAGVDPGTATATLSSTHTGGLKITVTINGATPGLTYQVVVSSSTWTWTGLQGTVDKNGNFKVSGERDSSLSPGNNSINVQVTRPLVQHPYEWQGSFDVPY